MKLLFKFRLLLIYLKTILLLRYKGINHGSIPLINGNPIINNKGNFIIGNKFSMQNTQFRTQITIQKDANLQLGNSVFINQGCNIYTKESIIIGNNVFLADLVMIHDTNFHEVEEDKGITSKSVQIDDNVWIGARSIIFPGVHLEKNVVVGAGSIVTKSFPKNSLIGGNPAKIIRKLQFSDDYIRT